MPFLKVVFGGLATGLIFALALNCAVAAVLGHGGRFSLKLDVLTHFSPFWLAGGLAALIASPLVASGSPRLATIVLAVIAILASGLQILPEYLRPFSPKGSPDAAFKIKIVQFNAWGFTHAPIDYAWITAQDPDIIVLEEATPQLIDALRSIRPYYVSYDDPTVPILSKRPPLTTHVERPKHWWPWAPMSRASFPAPGGAFDVVSVHYTWPTTGTQTMQMDTFAKVLRQYRTDRLIVSGDFNSTPWSYARRREDAAFGLERRTRALFSWPAEMSVPFHFLPPFPLLPIDHIYAGSAWRTVSIARGPRIGSDHYPVVITLALQPGPKAPGRAGPPPAQPAPPPGPNAPN